MQKVLIADDHMLVRMGMEFVVNEVLGLNCIIDSASDGNEVCQKLKLKEYDILISDISMPDTDGLELVASAITLQPKLRILIVSQHPEAVFAHRYLKAGALGYIQKGGKVGELKKALLNISLGKRFVSSSQAEIFTNTFLSGRSENPFDMLSGREFEVTVLLLKGLGILEVGNSLGINNSTVSTYRSRVFEKLGVKNLIELNKLANQYQIVVDSVSN